MNSSKRSGICRKGDGNRCYRLGIGTGGCQADELIGISNRVIEIIGNETDVESQVRCVGANQRTTERDNCGCCRILQLNTGGIDHIHAVQGAIGQATNGVTGGACVIKRCSGSNAVCFQNSMGSG